MPLFGLFGPKRTKISHEAAGNHNLETIANDTDFFRNGTGTTIVTGSVGHGVKLTILEEGNLTISGNIGSECSIYKDGSGVLIIEGTVADDLKLTIYGSGQVRFTRRPPESVLVAIKNPGGVAQILCEGVALPRPRQDYAHHNMGAAARRQPSPPPRVVYVQAAAPRHAAGPHDAMAAVDKYTDLTQSYIDATRAHQKKTIKARIEELALTAEEELLFKDFIDPISLDYFDDVPVQYNEKYFNLSTLLGLNKPEDPFTREPLKLANIQPARKVFNDLDEVIKKLKEQREVAKKALVVEEESVSPSM
jgi:hypothetical protein